MNRLSLSLGKLYSIEGTLLVTDTIIRVDDDPPEIIQDDPRALIYHSRDNMFSVAEDTKENRRKGDHQFVIELLRIISERRAIISTLIVTDIFIKTSEWNM
jgi:hypothetical protein